jgi:hypothetical protein
MARNAAKLVAGREETFAARKIERLVPNVPGIAPLYVIAGGCGGSVTVAAE